MGKQKALNPEDLWDLPHSDEAAAVSQVCTFAIICCISCLRHKTNALPKLHHWLKTDYMFSADILHEQ